MPSPHLSWQPSLFEVPSPYQEPSLREKVSLLEVPSLREEAGAPARPRADSHYSLRRISLDGSSWVDHVPGWLSGSDELFEELAASAQWCQRTRRMFDREVLEPRLTAGWRAASGVPLTPSVLEDIRTTLGLHYGVSFDSVGLNLYRDGRDSVAWHADRIAREIAEPVVALVSVGAPRPFWLRPSPRRGPGQTVRFLLGRGDLLVTGGRCQRDWQHSVPKVASTGPRISVAFRHGAVATPLGPGANDHTSSSA